MTAEYLINLGVVALHPEDTVRAALERMEEYHLPHLPLVRGVTFEGLLTEAFLLSQEESHSLQDFAPVAVTAYVHAQRHYYDALRIAAEGQLQLVAVLNEADEYIGPLLISDLLNIMAEGYGVQIPGGIIVVAIDQRDYSLAEVSRLVESNEVRILSAVTQPDPQNPQRLLLTMKMNRTDLGRVAATLERFRYQIVGEFYESEVRDNTKERLDSFLRYLNV